ncbi:MAG TPA: hypothetical protein VFA31_06975, partial [Candidatus Polarisedimenticolia bacterium]|nr:hypothetical protein [Candidatus Polarisedimenticolia bacterium]
CSSPASYGTRRDDDDVVLEQRLAVQIARRREASDDREPRAVCANELDDGLRGVDLNVELDERWAAWNAAIAAARVNPGRRRALAAAFLCL